MFQALCAKGGMTQEWGEFEKREAIFGEHVKRIPEQFIGPSAKRIKMPTLFQDVGEFSDLDETLRSASVSKGIQTDRVFRISRFDY
jgi:hypothetical protein